MIAAMPFDFAAVSAPFRMQPGLRRLAPEAEQLTPNRDPHGVLADKLAVLTGHADRALREEPGFDARPALRALSEQAAREHPQAWVVDDPTAWRARSLGWSVCDGAVVGDGAPAIGECLRKLPVAWRPAALLALAFAEDFAILDAATGRVRWLAVCLPSRWAPEDKIGRHFSAVHAPVADNQTLIAAAEHLIRLVTGAERWERFVWTISPDGRLAQHPRIGAAAAWSRTADPGTLATCAFFRSERQTFIPLSQVGQAVFTIQVESRPLVETVSSAEQADRLHAALASMSAAVLEYRGLTAARERLLQWLDARRGAPG
jgi:hypothetical protein